jgi:hypothetical protein
MFSIYINCKKNNSGCKKLINQAKKEGNGQFRYIAYPKKIKTRKSILIIKIDSKKKEWIGYFYNQGTIWGLEINNSSI